MGRKMKKKKSGVRTFVSLLLMAVIAVLVYKSIITIGNPHLFKKEYTKTSSYSSLNKAPDSSLRMASESSLKKASESSLEKASDSSLRMASDSSLNISSEKLNSPNAILIRLEDNTILMQKNSEEKIYPASLTKIMTAIVAIEKLSDLKEKIKLTNSMYQGLYEADASMAGFQPGELVRTIDLLYGVLLPSGAECCKGLAVHTAGSEQNFVEMMNQKAAELGMDNSHFENTTGLHNENHYATVKDLAGLLSYALQNDTFRKIFTSARYSTPPTNKHPDGITFYSTMFERLSNPSITGGKILGGKTGYTKEAGLCLASLAKEGKKEYILVTAGAKGDNHSEQYNISDAVAVYNRIGK